MVRVVVFNTEVDVGSLPVGAAQLWEFDLNGCVETGFSGDRTLARTRASPKQSISSSRIETASQTYVCPLSES
jgi:hypothetical protein